ncbi:MAG: ABC transporter substrate-binding protein [Synechococcales cyanobacterium M58_A2018_015]|nr:ABC transporter substrate-binding protein [Synechococcales cyanobacterium M58_A2018_015]
MKQSHSTGTPKPRHALAFALAVLATGALAAACQQTPTDTASSPTAAESPAGTTSTGGLKLGALLPATGDLSSIGQPMLKALPLLVETVNACGGVNGEPVTLVIEDDQTDPAAGTEAMTKLTEADKVNAVVGAFASSVSTAALDVAVRNQVPMISPGSTSPVFTERAKKGEFQGFWARTAPPDTYQAAALAKLAIDKGLTNVSTVVINNDYGVGFEKAFVAEFEKLGGTVLNKANPTRYDPKGTTFDTEAAAAFNPGGQKPDAVVAVLYAETGSILLKAAYEQGLTDGVQVLLTDGVQTEEFPQDVGKRADGSFILSGALGTVPGAGGPALADFTKLWQEKEGSAPGAFVPHTWDAAALLVLAAQAAGSNDSVAIRDKLREVASGGETVTDVCQGLALLREGKDINYDGASGKVDIDENGDVVGNYDVWTVNDQGKIDVIDQVTLN